MPKKKETYRDRWLREHPRVTFYLDRLTYDRLKELAASKNMSVKEFVLDHLIKGFNEYYDDAYNSGFANGYKEGRNDVFKMFKDNPFGFYNEFKKMFPNADVALFVIPCSVCGKPMIFHHKKDNWVSDVKPVLLEAFRDWRHVKCPSSSK
jgi:hypothetical protein